MTKNQFLIFYALFTNNIQSQRELSILCELSLGTVNKGLKFLEDKMLIEGYSLTELGKEQLDKYKVDNAIIMAAGMSSRFAPLSYEFPKGLLEVKGERLIERQIKQLREAGIEEIIIVVGYMKEKFFYLEDKYNVKILVNNDYYKRNNNSTLYVAQKHLKNSYICSSDNYFEINVFEPYVYDSYYSSVFNKGCTDEYCITTNSQGILTEVTVGGENKWIMIGHAYFSKDFSKKFLDILLTEYNDIGVDQMLWEDIYAKHIKDLDMYINKYEDYEIFEFDTLDDLRKFDPKYINNTDSKILKNICKVLECSEADIQSIDPIKKGLTNISFLFQCKGKKYVYRHPGAGTEEIINRISEAKSQNLAKQLSLDKTLIYISAEEGWKISHFIDNCVDFDYHDMAHVKKGLALVKKLHDANVVSEWDFNIYAEAEKLIMLTGKRKHSSFEDFENLRTEVTKIYNFAEKDGILKRICHNDCYSPNFLTNNQVMYLIDWEYSGNSDPASDLGTFICCSDYTTEEALEILKIYFGRELTEMEKRHYLSYVAISSYYWFVWALYKESFGEVVGEYLYLWYKYAKTYSKIALGFINEITEEDDSHGAIR
jgi:CTP:phosphocholine cytidylyltransferase-like protein/thiamine kinase-like enzyme